jgi:transposase
MRSADVQQGGVFSYIGIEERIPKDHPIRKLRVLVDAALKSMDRTFDALYAKTGRPSIPPERLLRALLLQIVYSVRSERLLMERMDYDLLFRWFAGLNIDDPVWDHSTFSFNRERLFNEDVAREFFRNTVILAEIGELKSDEHFTVDGTLLEAWASLKSFKPKAGGGGDGPSDGGRNPDVDFRGERRRNDTHASTTDPDARLARKGNGREAKLSYLANTLMENRNGLIVDVDVRTVSGTGERDGALDMIKRNRLRDGVTLGADKGYDTQAFVGALKERGIQPHIARNTSNRRSAVDGRTARGKGYAISQRLRKLIEQGFGWVKEPGGRLRKLRMTGLARVTAQSVWTFAAYNLVRLGGCHGWWNPAPT